MKKINRFRYAKKREKPSSSCMYPVEYKWIKNPIPVMINKNKEESGSIKNENGIDNFPAVIQEKRSIVNDF
jgi:hypothetical protein